MYIFTPNTLIKSSEINANYDELKTKTDYLTAPDSAWIEVGSGGTAPAFQNSWVNLGSVWETVGFRKDALGYVHIKGLMKSGTISATLPAFVLPLGYRPRLGYGIRFAVNSNNAFGSMCIRNDAGYLGYMCPEVGNNNYMFLDGITFLAEN